MTLFENNSNWNTTNMSFDQFDWNDIFFGKELGLWHSPDQNDLINDDLQQSPLRSIHLDCKQIESSSSSIAGTIDINNDNNNNNKNNDDFGFITDDLLMSDLSEYDDNLSKNKLRNRDCMWSGTCVTQTTNPCTLRQKQQNGRHQSQQKERQKTGINNNNNSSNIISCNYSNNGSGLASVEVLHREHNSETIIFRNNNNNNNNNNSIQSRFFALKENVQNGGKIPPGTSLLLTSRISELRKKTSQIKNYIQMNRSKNLSFAIPNVTTADFLKERESMPIPRPDTPLSLDDDPPEFKHNVDLAACVMGSNNISLDTGGYIAGIGGIGGTCGNDTSDKMIIKKLKEQLEDPTTKNIDLRLIPGNKQRSLSEVLNVIESESTMQMIKVEPIDYNDDDEDDQNDVRNNVANPNMIKMEMMSGDDDGEDDDDDDVDDDDDDEEDSEIDDIVDIMPTKSNKSENDGIYSASSITEIHDSITHDDHCYTRSNGAIDVVGMGLETPSDSDEEIDVVSIGDKKLPNNPSDKDRRALQTKVANKISARIVKTVNGVRTIPPRRRCSYEPYTAPVTPVKNSSPPSANQRYSTAYSYNHNNNNSNNTTNHHSSSAITTAGIVINGSNSNNNPTTAIINNNNNYNIISSNSSNKINSKSNCSSTINSSNCNNNSKYSVNSRKRSALQAFNKDVIHQNQQQQQQQQHIPSSTTTTPMTVNKRHRTSKKHKTSNRKHNNNCTIDEAETIEKRNLHNDMERQRRIGLKNLFEELKLHIPSIRDKERAPKVNILRESAKYCQILSDDEKKLMAHKHQLQLQLQRRIAQIQLLQMQTETITSSSSQQLQTQSPTSTSSTTTTQISSSLIHHIKQEKKDIKIKIEPVDYNDDDDKTDM